MFAEGSKNISSKLRTPLSSIKKAVVNQILLHTTIYESCKRIAKCGHVRTFRRNSTLSYCYTSRKEKQTKKHAHKGRAILDDKKTNETRSINQFIRTREEQRNGYNNLKATHRLRIPNVLLL